MLNYNSVENNVMCGSTHYAKNTPLIVFSDVAGNALAGQRFA